MSEKVEVQRIQDQLARAFSGEAWHGPPLLGVLAEVRAEEAAARPVAGRHAIWEIVNHIEAWLSIVRRRAGGASLRSVPREVDWPPLPDPSDAAWQAAQAQLQQSYLDLKAFVGDLCDADLDQKVDGLRRPYSVYEELHGVIQHSLYHLGQIVILAKRNAGPA